jgi:hypothetical protein
MVYWRPFSSYNAAAFHGGWRLIISFTCNLCGQANQREQAELTREAHTCTVCSSSVRVRSIIHVLSMELLGISIPLTEFPQLKSLRGIGTSDSCVYADRLAQKFDYRNTFYDSAPQLDLANPPAAEAGVYDFLISSEVFEHVPPPASAAFVGAAMLLKPTGVLVLTMPYSIEPDTVEHFPDMHEFGLARVGDHTVLVNRTRDGQLQVFDKVVFHGAERGKALEMRELTEDDVKRHLAEAGFSDVRIYADDYPPYGIFQSEAWSLPIAARRTPFGLGLDATREIVGQWRQVKQQLSAEDRIATSRWVRLGRKLGVVR